MLGARGSSCYSFGEKGCENITLAATSNYLLEPRDTHFDVVFNASFEVSFPDLDLDASEIGGTLSWCGAREILVRLQT